MKKVAKIGIPIVLLFALATMFVMNSRSELPFPFLDQYEIVDRDRNGDWQVLTLKVDANDLMSEARKHVPDVKPAFEADMHDFMTRHQKSPYVTEQDLFVSGNLGLYKGSPQSLASRPGYCSVTFIRRESALEAAKSWVASRFARGRMR